MSDFAVRRRIMVDTQVRPSDVTKFPIIDAMLTVPRERFVPDHLRETAYVGEHLPLSGGRVVLDPRVFAKMLETADIEPDDLVLDIGCGLGYSSAVMARLAEAVIAVEEDGSLASEAERVLGETGADNVAVIEGSLSEGAAKHGPYDVIMVEGGVEEVPETILQQLKDGGRVVAIFNDGHLGTVRVGHHIDGAISWRYAFNAEAPVLEGFVRARDFVF
ncbi:methyltransferase domain-containing protein [Alphaproteobacteria bacterium GH1-50]|uniref:Protein-L-isoaspartate O-methyltransferase n=1 Tax=Kangsaoukella pontilimi TaxID=2691042 RepID=A0A7C9IRW7_9RHOB|nr:protein-L-isoaspartate O-methyltransferase [Kangsaoukella pontilimi]MXQ08006.1 methyltransferase domain-containing protein [Kangsaoukella pontilimi]